jgi:hypothetical protein
MEVITRTISDLLPNPQVLNFHEGMPVLPDWVGRGLRLMMGAGDLNHGDIPNVQMFTTYDVFFCQPWDWNGSLRQNVTYLIANRPHALLCFIDNSNAEQVKRFTTLFAGRFAFIDGHGGHTPHISPSAAALLLEDGGVATNMYENAETIITPADVNFWLEKGYFKGFISPNIITARISGSTEDIEMLRPGLHAKALQLSAVNKQIRLPQDKLDNIASYSVRELQSLIRGLLFESSTPPNLVGSWVTMHKDWQSNEYETFVFTKVPLDFQETALEAYRVRYGNEDPHYLRARKIIGLIQDDLDRETVFPASAKYNTYKRHMQANILPVC